jgi:Protein ENHANCED DISEASE RESISTANCE 2, C-terminal
MSSSFPASFDGGDGGGKNITNNKTFVSFATAPSDVPSSSSSISSGSPFLDALSHGRVTATVIDLDHYRIHGGMAVETDYIVQVQAIPKKDDYATTAAAKDKEEEEEEEFDAFLLSKTFSAFRHLAQQLKKAVDAWSSSNAASTGGARGGANSDDATKVAKYCELVGNLVDSQKNKQYLGKVNYGYVKVLAKNRTTLINNVLHATCSQNYIPVPSSSSSKAQKGRHADMTLLTQVASIVETFFLTDHCSSADETAVSGSGSGGGGGGSSHRNLLLGGGAVMPMLEKIITTVEDGVANAAQKTKDGVFAAAAQKTKEQLTRGTSDSGGGHGHHRTGSNPLGWLPFMDNNKDKDGKKEGTTTTTTTATAATTGSGRSGGSGQQRRMSLVVPLTTKDRRSETLRAHDEEELASIHDDDSTRLLLLDDGNGGGNDNDHRPRVAFFSKSYARSQPAAAVRSTSNNKMAKLLDAIANKPIVLVGICAITIALIRQASLSKVIIDADMALLVVFASYCLGLHTPRNPSSMDDMTAASPRMLVKSGGGGMVEDRSGRKLLARSMKAQRRHSTSTNSRRNSLSATTMVAAAHNTSSPGISGSAHDNNDDGGDDCDDDPSGASFGTMSDGGGGGDDGDDHGYGEIMGSPMAMFPEGAKIGSVTNCWGVSAYEDFQVRGATYLTDKQKVASDEYLFPVRGVDLFLTDMCPENVGANDSIFGGHMRSLPTLLVNFRLPWGVFICYYEIPTKFVPYLQLCYEPDHPDFTPEKKAQLLQDLDNMSPGERCAARFLMKDQSHKNQTFKIIPYVVNGPWVVRQVVGGKPALIGNKLPISWVYQSAEKNATSTGAEQKACYLEADLDIAASSAARSILSVARTYCQVLTLDLGFVVQGNTEDELPEQMLVGCRLHGIDPLTSPSFPMSTHQHDNPLFDVGNNSSGDGSDDDSSHFGRTG